ncbi:MAG: histidine kinase [bacterium]
MTAPDEATSRPSARPFPAAVIAFAGWTAVALFFANRLFFSSQLTGPPISWIEAISWSFLDWYLWAALSPFVFRASRRFPLGRGAPMRNVFVHLLLSLLFTVVHSTIYGTIVWNMRWVPAQGATLTGLVQSLFFGKFHLGVVTYWVLVVLRHTFDFYTRYREEELRVSRMEAQLAQAQLQALRMQLHPHFLFNTLNAVSALMHKDVDAADRMLARLSDFLRLTLETGGAHEVSLRQELEFLKRYLEIEQTRFADRLRVRVDVDPSTLEARVPNLILQPLVENAIRHGVARSASAGCVEIAAHRRNGALFLEVRDDGPGLPDGGLRPPREGVGLANTRARLAQLYGAGSSLDLANRHEGGVAVTLTIPFRTEAAANGAHGPEEVIS